MNPHLQLVSNVPTKSWAGGRYRDGKYIIERMVNTRRYGVTLDVKTLDEALLELRLFLANPERYVEARQERLSLARGATKGPDPSLWAPELLKAYRKAKERACRDVRYVDWSLRYLQDWQKAIPDLRVATLQDLTRALDRWQVARINRTAALRAYTKWLRKQGHLKRADDVSLELEFESTKSKRLPEDRAYQRYFIEATYAALDRQPVRDVFLLRILTGMHDREINRLANGQGKLRIVNDPSGIYAVAVFLHKSGKPHVLSLDRRCYDAVQRLKASGCPKDYTINNCLIRAAGAGTKLQMSRLRHTFATMALSEGRKVLPTGTQGGLDRSVVAEQLGHSQEVNQKHYQGFYVPVMIVLPLELVDPA